MGRTVVIGDIHGCFDELIDLLELIDLKQNDRVVAVGDLVVKGEKNREVLDRFIDDRRFSSVIGNHDRVLRQSWRGEPVRLTKAQRKTQAELNSNRARYAAYLKSLRYTIDLGSMAADMTQIRTMGTNPASRKGVPWYKVYRGKKIVLFGHWPAAAPRVAPRAIGLDTGCVYGGRLTAFIIEAAEFVSVPARRAYEPPRRQLR